MSFYQLKAMKTNGRKKKVWFKANELTNIAAIPFRQRAFLFDFSQIAFCLFGTFH
jgi:hypothetical protein